MHVSSSSSHSLWSSPSFSLSGGVNIKETIGLMFLAFSLANPTITGRGENTSLMQSMQDSSTSARSKHIFFLLELLGVRLFLGFHKTNAICYC